MKNKIIPAIIATSQEELNTRINKVKDQCQILQLDVMDGRFVPTHSLDFDFKLPETSCKYEAHLMISDPEAWIEKNSDSVDLILIHMGSTDNIKKAIDLAKSKDKKIGLVLNPDTPIEKIKPYLNQIDEVLIMTVNPGFYGGHFLPETLDKVKELRKLKPNMDIEVDGGINPDTIKQAYQAGANLFICGSYLQKSQDVKEALEALEKHFN